jgi:predicted transcriptional regulator of viral defense system
MTILDDVYKYTLQKRVVTVKELKQFAHDTLKVDYKYLYKKFLNRLLSEEKLKRITKGMYAAKNIYTPEKLQTDRYLLASKIRSPYYIGFHAALELHGCAYSMFNTVHVAVTRNSYFQPFIFENVTYKPVIRTIQDFTTETQQRAHEGTKITLSSPSRTFVDCIDHQHICGGYEEVLKSIESLGGVTIEGILRTLALYDKDILYRSIGYILQIMQKTSIYYGHITNEDLKNIQNKIGEKPRYLIKDSLTKYNKQWNLYVPKDFEELLMGIR